MPDWADIRLFFSGCLSWRCRGWRSGGRDPASRRASIVAMIVGNVRASWMLQANNS
jgi:hypothetical protein